MRKSIALYGYYNFYCVYCAIYFTPKGINFLGLSENKMEAGYDSRFRMVCSGIFSLGLFFYFNKFLIYGSKNTCYTYWFVPFL